MSKLKLANEIINVNDGLMFSVVIQNCVASVDLFTKIDVVGLFQSLIDHDTISVAYYPDKFPGLILKIKEPKISSLVFSSGKLVITGAKSSEMVHIAVRQIKEILIEYGKIKCEHEQVVTIQNIVASGNLNKEQVNLELASMWLDNSMYEPEQFPGLIYRLPKPKTVLLLFQSGNVVCTGAKTEDDVHLAVRKTYENLIEVDAFLSEDFYD